MNISIIIPTKNSRQYLEDTLSSIKKPEGSSVNIYINDCLSIDGSQDTLINSKNLPVFFNSNRDLGVASALNNFFRTTSADILGWLNSDDLYAPGAIKNVLDIFKSNPNIKIIYGLGRHIDASGRDLGLYPTLPPSVSISKFSDGSFICQPTVFFRREVFFEVGLLDESLRTAFDLDFWLRIFKRYRKNQIGFINKVQAYSRLHDQCLTRRFRQIVALESMQVIAKHLGSAPGHWILTYFDELCARYPFIEEKESIVEIVKNVLNKAKIFMKPAEFNDLVKTLQRDFRLTLANPHAFVNVQPDGWVSKKLIAKLRYKKDGKRTLILNCQGGWPSDSSIHLTIRSASGHLEKVKISSQDEFILTLEAPETDTEAFTAWIVETRQFFVPAKALKNSKDLRKLSFRVNGLFVQ
jgi:glycosyltransferase involved in cell wall biosynthesis